MINRKVASLTEIHKILGLQKPSHPLISLIDYSQINFDTKKFPNYDAPNFYKITCITKLNGKFKYGRGFYDFKEGSMLFTSPNQAISYNNENTMHAGYALCIDPDFFQGFSIIKKIKDYGYFSYSSNEALHLSDSELNTVLSMFKFIHDELNSGIDEFTQEVIIAQIELLLSYANRFYKRQFFTRKAVNSDLLEQVEKVLNEYFGSEKNWMDGIVSVKRLAKQLNVSPRYLSDILRHQTGRNAQQHIHDKMIELAKEKLSITKLSVSEVAYHLGFQHPHSFSKLFKSKTNLSPIQFRRSL